MKRLWSIVIIFCFIQIMSNAQIKQKIANPGYLSIILIDQPSVDKMTEVCEYYDLTEKPDENEYKVFSHKDGTEFRFKVDNENDRYYPVVKVSTRESQKSIDKVLSNAGYVKQGADYVKGAKFEHRRIRCKVSGGATKTLTFTKEYNCTNY